MPKRAVIVFEKNQQNPFNSRIYLRVWAKQKAKTWVPVEESSWRAGSGLGGAAGRDSCHRDVGWLPNGDYAFVQHDRRNGPAIKGRVFELQTKACHNGTVRQLLFIHSEQTQPTPSAATARVTTGAAGRCRPTTTTSPTAASRWRPGPLRQLTRHFHRYFKAERRYPTSVVKVRVRD